MFERSVVLRERVGGMFERSVVLRERVGGMFERSLVFTSSKPATPAPALPQPAPAKPATPTANKASGGPGGGHHVPAKRAFEGAPGYDPNKALAIPKAELEKLGIQHIKKLTPAQMKAYKEFADTGQKLTWEAIAKIETSALVEAGMSLDMAKATVAKAIQALKDAGVVAPVRIPWGK